MLKDYEEMLDFALGSGDEAIDADTRQRQKDALALAALIEAD